MYINMYVCTCFILSKDLSLYIYTYIYIYEASSAAFGCVTQVPVFPSQQLGIPMCFSAWARG